MKKLLYLLIITLLLITSTACNRNKKTKAQENISANKATNALSMLPKSTLGFFSIDSSTKSFQDFTKTALYQDTNFSKDLEQVFSSFKILNKNKNLLKIYNLLYELNKESIFVGSKPENSLQNIFFFYGEDKKQINFAALLTAKKPKQFLNKIEAIKNIFIRNGLQVTERIPKQYGGAKVLEITKAENPKKMLLIVDDSKLLITLDEKLVNRLFSVVNKKTDQRYNFNQELPASLKNKISTNSHLIGFVNIEKIIQATKDSISEEDNKIIKMIPQQLIFTSSLKNKVFANNLYTKLNSETLPEELQRALTNNKTNIWSRFSTSSVMNLSLNVNSIKEIVKLLIRVAPDETAKSKLRLSTGILSMLSDQSEIGISLTNFNTSGLPELQIIAPVVNPEEKLGLIKQLVNSNVGKGMGGITWQTKNLEIPTANPVDYIITPFGVGLYLSHNNQELLISSSETAMKNLLSNNTPFKSPAQVDFKPGSPFYNFYLDYAKLYRVAMNVKNMLAMFLPQNPEIEVFFQNLEKFKNYGAVYCDNNFSEGVLTMRGLTYPMELANTNTSQR